MKRPLWSLLLCLAWVSSGALGQLAPSVPPPLVGSELPENERGFVRGYLSPEEYPNSLTLLPPPPAAGSPAFLADEDAYRTAKGQRTPERLAQAVSDGVLRFPSAGKVFASALGIEISEAETPHLVTLLRRSLTDAGRSTYAAKDHYRRIRPFAAHEETCCTPEQETTLRQDGSYPSGHTAIGWAWALILTELAPERADVILKRGYEFGESRLICGVHWQSDVTAGRLVAAAVVARLHSSPVFLAQVAEAKKEIARARAKL